MKIHFLRYKNIDFEAYNRCVENSPFATMYALSWYLDAVSPQWELLMAEDYRYVMPLPVKRKWGLRVLVQPLFCQQLGIFSSGTLSAEVYRAFVSALPYRICRMHFNPGNRFDSALPLRNNYCLDLNHPYTYIRGNYGSNFVRNLRKAGKENLFPEMATEWRVFLEVLKTNAGERPIRHQLKAFEAFIEQIGKQVKIEIRSVKDERATILSSALFVRWKRRIYYLMSVSTAEGKEKQSMAFLLDKFLEDHAGNELVFDCEGSSLPGVARFYAGMGAVNECFPEFSGCGFLFAAAAFVKKLR
ncbi:MAG: hypothetical protein LBH61_06035 [Dysgonamonadaceae bacterium]|jgi:hypothetical protein|nr:hypothetical protein [Dysgonamonadaceae bacterium]